MSTAVTAALASLLVCTPAVAFQQTSSSQAKPTFRSAVDLVSIAAVVRDRHGRFARGLRKEDFVIEEEGARRDIVDFHADDNAPVRVALLFDVSGSMRLATRLDDARQAARQLLSALRLGSSSSPWEAPGDEAAVFSFDMNLQSLQSFTSDPSAIERALARVAPYGQTSLYDAIALTAEEVANTRSGDPHRRAVVVFTDGIDTSSRLSPEKVSALASSIDVPVYVITVASDVDRDAIEREYSLTAKAEGALRSLSHMTGGEAFVTSAPAHESIAVRQVVDELRHQYVMAVATSATSGWHALSVKTRQKDLTVRARSGYSAGGRKGSDSF
jgi:Ca-activated chloride channel family protein